ncbi:hypothetical protein ABB37_03697 [Leptomonas pyrrhocoris]|uniref:Uncharacterized protein n=1 Tax=Leptomonas pyrrhocoris TaxID=157538 RepID=A0A0N0DW51_LEPPY|nr:hypothetical protein ABB37_03697 [Leptomonas pyrrhocoris]KPA81291.1 hypothetical protein ABB37_03697 [Leptomonas pyrrhocoris]|eukprot:XP_015659730.1 hypothetical protein ABB37_03697 [Leptomonas pyrrhocoris]
MTHVVVNNEECTVQIKGDFIVLLYTAVAKEATHVGARNVSQLLRSRKDETAAKMVADGVSYLLKFASMHERESFIESIVRIQEAPPEQSNEDWVASSICRAAVDVGMLDERELQAVVSAEGQRGVEQAFEALEGLVDRDTFELLPITEQMENDVLRQIPVLAAIFRDRVVDKETKRVFWEAVVRKYFCFARTFLEEDIQRLEAAKPAVAVAVPSDGLAAINASSLNALPKGAAAAMVDTDINEEDLLHIGEAEENGKTALSVFFGAYKKTHPAEREVCPISIDSYPFPDVAAHDVARRPRFLGRHVLHQFPSETIEKSALETLRLFWRSGTRQRSAVLAKYTSAKQGRSSFIQRMCLEQAQHTVEEDSA